MTSMAFLGLGNMGIGMAGHLLAAGHALHVYNRTPSRAVWLGPDGALRARLAPGTFVMVRNTHQRKQCHRGCPSPAWVRDDQT